MNTQRHTTGSTAGELGVCMVCSHAGCLQQRWQSECNPGVDCRVKPGAQVLAALVCRCLCVLSLLIALCTRISGAHTPSSDTASQPARQPATYPHMPLAMHFLS